MGGKFIHLFVFAMTVSLSLGSNPSNSTPYKYLMQARFSMGGLRGAVMFQQKSINSLLEIKVQFDKLAVEGDWGIFSNPSIFNGGPKDSCSSDIVGPLITNGNLTNKHSHFAYKAIYNNDLLKAFGKQSILGASLVMVHPSTHALWGCATILPFNESTMYSSAMYATATFKGVVAGEIRFLQNSNNASSEVAIIGNLYYTDGRTAASDNHGWYISTSSASGYNQCEQLKDVLQGSSSTTGSCSVHEPQACKMGDLSSKLNNISIGIANSAKNVKKFRIIDISLDVTAILGHALVIRNSAGVPFACANIQKSGPILMKSSFEAANNDGVSGSVTFSQQSPYHSTVIDYSLNGLNNKAKGIHVHQYPIATPSPASPCSAASVGSHLNPYGINNKASNYPADGEGVTLDNYEVGDLSGKFGNLAGSISNYSQFVDDQIDLYGRFNIWNRALVIHRNDASGSRWVCANIVPITVSKLLSATANFTISSELVGNVNFKQLMLPDGIMTDTAIGVEVAYKNASKTTKNHNWHIHIEPVGSDGMATISDRCKSVGPHYNPFNVNTTAGYSSECSPKTPFRCELGDLNGKQAKYSIGTGKKYFFDANTPLFGAMSVIGRSVTFHTENAGAPRLACADIVPDSITAVAQIEHSFPEAVPFNKTAFKEIIMNALTVKEWQVQLVKDMKSKKPCRKAVFYILDNNTPQNGANYKTKFEKIAKSEQSKLGKYKTCTASDGAGFSMKADPSVISLLLSSIVFLILTKK